MNSKIVLPLCVNYDDLFDPLSIYFSSCGYITAEHLGAFSTLKTHDDGNCYGKLELRDLHMHESTWYEFLNAKVTYCLSMLFYL